MKKTIEIITFCVGCGHRFSYPDWHEKRLYCSGECYRAILKHEKKERDKLKPPKRKYVRKNL